LDSTKAAAASEFATIDGQSVIVKGDSERNWRRVGLALDRVGLTVRQVEASQRIYIVQPTTAESEAVSNEKPGLFKRVFSRKKKETVTARDSLVVKLIPVQGGDRLVILDKQAAPYKGRDLNQYLSRLQTELR
jgi:outer membrane protein assembly factor BamC